MHAIYVRKVPKLKLGGEEELNVFRTLHMFNNTIGEIAEYMSEENKYEVLIDA